MSFLADLPDAVALWEKLGREDSAPGVVPVLYKPTPEDLAKAQQVTKCVGQAAKRKARTLLAVVDEMVGQRKKGEPSNCAPAAPRGTSWSRQSSCNVQLRGRSRRHRHAAPAGRWRRPGLEPR